MASSRKEFEGELIAWLLKNVYAAVWVPNELPDDLNGFREPKPLSKAMKKHLEAWAKRRWRVATGG
jgi:hypothetical protein